MAKMNNHQVNIGKLFAIMLIASIGFLFSPSNSNAVNPDEILTNPALEQRARDLSTKLRCLVCQNQSIDDSDASLAKDLRLLLRKRLVAGDSDEQVINYIVSRYGEFVLLQPRFGLHTLILWSLPLLLIIVGLFLAFFKFKNRETKEMQKLTSDENEAITKLLGESE